MIKLLQNKKTRLLLVVPVLAIFLSGCAGFRGLRTPKYDGKPVERNDDAIALYERTQRINEENETHYFRYPLSETLKEPSLAFSEKASVTLEKGTYTVGDDLPAGRVILLGQPSDFRPEVFIIRAGNLTVYDEEGVVAFENHFQENSGVMQAVVDLREGQTVEVEGDDPEIDVHYSEDTARASTLMDPTESDQVALMAGHYEVGEHLEPGNYTLERVAAPRTPVLYHFIEGEINVVELTQNRGIRPRLSVQENEEWFESGRIAEEEYENNLALFENRPDRPVIELKAGDKLYLPMLDGLILEKH
ncbi:MAG: hypothetical protein U5K84_14680 [Alkalibacterium sp.]|nr:hypothetical protein [Alkalibacterium sp.]